MLWNDYIIAAGLVIGASIIGICYLIGLLKIAQALKEVHDHDA